MKPFTTLILCAGLCLLSACDSSRPGKSNDKRNSVIIGDYRISWARASAKTERLAATTIFFGFNHAKPYLPSELPNSAWAKEAVRRKMTVEDLKTIYGQTGHFRFEVYMTPDGHIHSCTIEARKKKLCGQNEPKPLKLSIKTRTKLAQQALETSSECRWLGFDEGYNLAKSSWAGAMDATLWVKADCR